MLDVKQLSHNRAISIGDQWIDDGLYPGREPHIVPFGKYAGQSVYKIDDLDYLVWLKKVAKSKNLIRHIDRRLKSEGLRR